MRPTREATRQALNCESTRIPESSDACMSTREPMANRSPIFSSLGSLVLASFITCHWRMIATKFFETCAAPSTGCPENACRTKEPLQNMWSIVGVDRHQRYGMKLSTHGGVVWTSAMLVGRCRCWWQYSVDGRHSESVSAPSHREESVPFQHSPSIACFLHHGFLMVIVARNMIPKFARMRAFSITKGLFVAHCTLCAATTMPHTRSVRSFLACSLTCFVPIPSEYTRRHMPCRCSCPKHSVSSSHRAHRHVPGPLALVRRRSSFRGR